MKKFLLSLIVTLFLFGLFSLCSADILSTATSQTKDSTINGLFLQAYDYFWSGHDALDDGNYTTADKGDATKAIEYFGEAQSIMEKYYTSIDFENDDSVIFMSQLYTRLGLSYNKVGNYEKAMAIFNKGLALDGIDRIPAVYKAYLVNNVGSQMFNMGKYTEGLIKFIEALKIFPELELAQNNIAFLDLTKKSISWMYENGLTRFSIPRAFMYEQEISREQASKFFVEFSKKYLNLPEKNISCNFKDFKMSDPTLKSYITSVCKMDILKGNYNLFSPKDKLKYVQLITIISRMLDGTGFDNNKTNFREEHVSNLYSKGILDDLEIDVDSIATRGDIAIMLYNTYLYLTE